MDLIARARAHAERGNTRAAIELLKPIATAEHAPYEARRALAGIYREIGAPDQAGRWGIVIEGWTTPFERDRLARALAVYHDPAVFLSLPAGAGEPADLANVLELRTKHSDREAERRRMALEAWKSNPKWRAHRREEMLWAAAAVLFALGAVAPTAAVWTARMLSHDAWAAGAAGIGWSLSALAALVIAIGRWAEDRRLRPGASGWAGLAMAAVAAGHFLLAAHWSAA